MAGETDKLEIYRDKRGKFRWRRVAPNGRVVGKSAEGYERERDAEANMTRGHVADDAWEFYKDRADQWRWRRTAQNGQIVGCSSEGYSAKADAIENAMRQGYRG